MEPWSELPTVQFVSHRIFGERIFHSYLRTNLAWVKIINLCNAQFNRRHFFSISLEQNYFHGRFRTIINEEDFTIYENYTKSLLDLWGGQGGQIESKFHKKALTVKQVKMKIFPITKSPFSKWIVSKWIVSKMNTSDFFQVKKDWMAYFGKLMLRF